MTAADVTEEEILRFLNKNIGRRLTEDQIIEGALRARTVSTCS